MQCPFAYEHIYKNTAEGSPLRRYNIWQSALHLQAEAFKKSIPLFPKEFLADVAMFFKETHNASPIDMQSFMMPVDR